MHDLHKYNFIMLSLCLV